MAESIVNVVAVKLDADLRKVHSYRKRWSGRLKARQAALLINRAKDRARLIDSVGGCHNYYAPAGEQFDAREIKRQVAALGLRVALHPVAAQEVNKERPARTRRAA